MEEIQEYLFEHRHEIKEIHYINLMNFLKKEHIRQNECIFSGNRVSPYATVPNVSPYATVEVEQTVMQLNDIYLSRDAYNERYYDEKFNVGCWLFISDADWSAMSVTSDINRSLLNFIVSRISIGERFSTKVTFPQTLTSQDRRQMHILDHGNLRKSISLGMDAERYLVIYFEKEFMNGITI